jgi:hypothetical protein
VVSVHADGSWRVLREGAIGPDEIGVVADRG